MNEVFVIRARQLRTARELIKDESAFASATALLSVHAAMALNDALLTIWRGKPTRSEDHQSAVRETEAQCRSRKLDNSGVKHLKSLIGSKSAISYGDEAVTQEKAEALRVAATRFEAWTFKMCKELTAWE